MNIKNSAALFLAACLSVVWSDDSDVERKPISVKSNVDFGQVIKGSNLELASGGGLELTPIQRTGISVIQEISIQNRLDIRVGVGGLFWYAWPQLAASPHTQIVRFGPGISTAHGRFKFGHLDDPWMTAQFGFYSYKYNPDALNLGEYLFRSTAYPGLLYTGGWSFINSAAHRTTGIRLSFSHLDGAFEHDAVAFLESDIFPFNSISPGWVGTLKVAGGALEIGAGFSYQHLIPMKPSQLTPNDPLSKYVRLDNFPAIEADTGRAVIDNLEGQFVTNHRGHAGGAFAGLEQEIMTMRDADGNKPYDMVVPINSPEATPISTDDAAYLQNPAGYRYLYPRTTERISFQGIKLMGRVAVDFKRLFGWEESLNPPDLRLFMEAAILGLENQPFYYEDITKRIPVMVGFNFPTFGLLNILSVQLESYRLDFLSSEEKSFKNNLPVYKVPNNIAMHHASENRNHDDFKWSVYGSRSLFKGIDVYLQFASDHMRLQQFTAEKTWEPVLNRPSEWYYLIRFDYGI